MTTTHTPRHQNRTRGDNVYRAHTIAGCHWSTPPDTADGSVIVFRFTARFGGLRRAHDVLDQLLHEHFEASCLRTNDQDPDDWIVRVQGGS